MCTAENLNRYLELLKSNFVVLNGIHQGLFLGKTNLRQFRDQRLVVSRGWGGVCGMVGCWVWVRLG